jgi:predicted nucleic acid-binding Zn ribbon protein
MPKKNMRRRKQKAELQPIGDVLFPLLKKRGLTSKIEENALLKLWPRAVGPQIASKTKPDSLRNGTLFVKTVSSVWVQQLHFVKDDILDKLNQLYEKSAIKEIRFVVGHTLEREKAQENASAEKKVMLKKRDKEMIAECTDAMADRELADILKRVMQVEISRRRQRENSKAR